MAEKAIPGGTQGYNIEEKSNSPKKKTKLTVGEVLFRIEHRQYKNCEHLVSLLIAVWSCLAGHVGCFPDIQATFQFMYRETATAILSKSFAKINQNRKRGLSRSLVQCSQVLEKKVKNVAMLCSSLVMCIYDPWGDPALHHVLYNETVDENVVSDFIVSEPVELLLLRIESLVNVGLETCAIRFCRYCLKSELLAKTVEQRQREEEEEQSIYLVENWKLPFIEWLLRILFRKRLLSELVAESAACNCHDGVRMINKVKKADWPESKALTETLINVFLVRDLLFQKNYCCTKELMSLWCEMQVITQKSIEEVQEASRQLLDGHASSSAHFYLFIDSLWEKYGMRLLPLYLEMFIRGLTSDLNFLESARQADDKEAVIELENSMSAVYLKISTLFCDISKEISLECMLSSFSLDPTQEKLNLIKKLSLQISVERSKRILSSNRSKTAGKSRCGKPHDMQPVLTNCLQMRKNCVITCDRAIQVGESPHSNNIIDCSSYKDPSEHRTLSSEDDHDINDLLQDLISQLGEIKSNKYSNFEVSNENIITVVNEIVNNCIEHVLVCEKSVNNVTFKCSHLEDHLNISGKDEISMRGMLLNNIYAEKSSSQTSISKSTDEALVSPSILTLSESNSKENSIETPAVIVDAVNELIGVVVDASDPSKFYGSVQIILNELINKIAIKETVVASHIDCIKNECVQMKLTDGSDTEAGNSKRSESFSVRNALKPKELFKPYEDENCKGDRGSFPENCDINCVDTIKESCTSQDNIPANKNDINSSETSVDGVIPNEINKNEAVVSPSRPIATELSILLPTSSQVCNRTSEISKSISNTNSSEHGNNMDIGDLSSKDVESVVDGNKNDSTMPCNLLTPGNKNTAINMQSSVSFEIASATESANAQVTYNEDDTDLCRNKRYSDAICAHPFHHVVLDAEIPGVSRPLLADFVIVLESLRDPQLKSTSKWSKLKDVCKEYLQAVTAQRCKFLNSQLNESVDSERDSMSEITAIRNHDFASFQSDSSVCNDPIVDRTLVFRRFMNTENNPKYNAFLNLSDLQNMYIPLDRLLCADASSSRRDRLKHHRKHRNKDRDPKKQALRRLHHTSRHNRDAIKRKKKKRRKGKKEKTRNKKRHSTHNKNGREVTNKKKKRIRKKKDSPVDVLGYCSDFSSTELMRIVNEHSNNFPQPNGNASRIHNNVAASSGESDMIINYGPTKKKSKQVNFKKLKVKKNSVVKSHDKHKHNKNKVEKKEKKKSQNASKLNAVQDYSHIVQFSSVKQMQSVQIHQSAVAVDISNVANVNNNNAGRNLTLDSSTVNHENLRSSNDPRLKTCSQEEMMNIQMLLANKQPQVNTNSENPFGDNWLVASNKQSCCSVLKYVSSKMTSRLLSVAQASNQLVIPNPENNTSVNDGTMISSKNLMPQTTGKYLLARRNLLPMSKYTANRNLVPISVCSASVNSQMSNITKSTPPSPIITAVTFPVAQNIQLPSGNKLVAGKIVIPLGGCITSTSCTDTQSKISDIVVTSGNRANNSAKSLYIVKKGNTNPQLAVCSSSFQNILPMNKNASNIKGITLPPVPNRKNATYLNKVKPYVAKKIFKKYIPTPTMSKSSLISKPNHSKEIVNSVALPAARTKRSKPISVPIHFGLVKPNSAAKAVAEENINSLNATPIMTVSSPMFEVISNLISDLLLVITNYEAEKTVDSNTNVHLSPVAFEQKVSSSVVQLAEDVTFEETQNSEAKKVDSSPAENSSREYSEEGALSDNSVESPLAYSPNLTVKERVMKKTEKAAIEDKTDDLPRTSSSVSTSSTSTLPIFSPATVTTSSTSSLTKSAIETLMTNHASSVEKLQPLVVSATVRPQGMVISTVSKTEGTHTTDTPTRSLTSISDAVRFSLMDMDDATGSVENQVLQAFNAFPQETVNYTNQVNVNTSEASISSLTNSTSTNLVVSQASQAFQASIRTSQSESFSECQITASTTTEWNASDSMVSPGTSAKVHETDSASELKDEERIKKKRKKKEKIERDPETLQRFWCEICNRGFFSAYNLRRHCRNVHKMALPKGTSDVPFTTSNSQCLAQVGDRVICTTVPDSETPTVAQQLSISNKPSEFLLQSPTHDPKTKEYPLQTSPSSHSKPIQPVAQTLNQSPNFTLHSPPPSSAQTPASLPITPPKDFRLQPPTSVSLTSPQHSNFIPIANTIPKPVPKFQRLQSGGTAVPQTHGLPRIGSSHQPPSSVPTSSIPQSGLMQSNSSVQKPTETQTTNLIQPLPCQVQQIQQATQCALSQNKKPDQRVGMLQAAQQAAQEQALRQARHAAELQQVQRAMQQAKKSVAASQLSKADSLQQSPPQIQPTSALSHLQSPILNPQMQKLVQIRQAALCGSPEFTLQLPNQTATSDAHTASIKTPLQYFQTQVPSTQHPAVLHSAVRQTLASCTATRQNQATVTFPGQPLQNMTSAEFLSRIVPHPSSERSSCSQAFPAMSAADLCLVSSQMHMPIIRQTETNEGLEDLEQFLLENMPWSGEQIASQGIVQHSLNRMNSDSVALPIPVKPGGGVMQQPKNMPLIRNKPTISKPKPYKPPIPPLTKNLGGSKGSSVKKKTCSKKGTETLGCTEGIKTGFVPSVGNVNTKNLSHCSKIGEKSVVGCTTGVTSEPAVSSSLNENDSHSSDSVQCIEITHSSQPSKNRVCDISSGFNPFPQREPSAITDAPGFYSIGLKRPDHLIHCSPTISETIPRIATKQITNSLSSIQHVSSSQHVDAVSASSNILTPKSSAGIKHPLSMHCSDHAVGLSDGKSQGAKNSCATKTPPKQSLRKFAEPLPKPSENLSPIEKEREQVNPVIPIFDPNPLQNDNVDAEKEFNNLQSKISDCEKHLKNSESKDESKNNNHEASGESESHPKTAKDNETKEVKERNSTSSPPKDNVVNNSINNQERKASNPGSEKSQTLCSSFNQKQSSDGQKSSTGSSSKVLPSSDKHAEKLGKVPKGIHFLDDLNDSVTTTFKKPDSKNENRSDLEYKEGKLLPVCSPKTHNSDSNNASKGHFVKPLGQKETPLFSHSTSDHSIVPNFPQTALKSPSCNLNSNRSDTYHSLACSPIKDCHSLQEKGESQMHASTVNEKADLSKKISNGSFSHNNPTTCKDKKPQQKDSGNEVSSAVEATSKAKQTLVSNLGLQRVEKNISSYSTNLDKRQETNAKDFGKNVNNSENNILLSENKSSKEVLPMNGKDTATDKDIMHCNLKESMLIENVSAKGDEKGNKDVFNDGVVSNEPEHTKTGDTSLSPIKQMDLDAHAVLGRTRLRDTPKTSVKRSCPCCTDSCLPKKCRANANSGNLSVIVRSAKMLSPTKLNSNSKIKNTTLLKARTSNGPSGPVQTRSSHRLRSKTGPAN